MSAAYDGPVPGNAEFGSANQYLVFDDSDPQAVQAAFRLPGGSSARST
jgi:hypothetical protein